MEEIVILISFMLVFDDWFHHQRTRWLFIEVSPILKLVMETLILTSPTLPSHLLENKFLSPPIQRAPNPPWVAKSLRLCPKAPRNSSLRSVTKSTLTSTNSSATPLLPAPMPPSTSTARGLATRLPSTAL